MLQPWATGPVQFWAALGGGGEPLPLCYAETTPDIQFNVKYSNLMSTLAGNQLPHARLYQGQNALIPVVASLWDEGAYSVAADVAGTEGFGDAHPGVEMPGDIGRIMEIEGSGYQLWLVFPYAEKTFQPEMPKGYHFWNVYLDDHKKLKSGTENQLLSLIFYCARIWDNDLTNEIGIGGWKCWDFDISAVAGQEFPVLG